MKKILHNQAEYVAASCFLAVWFSIIYFTGGCAGLSPGADPLVVRTEQTETFATNTFYTFLSIEANDQVFIEANFPAIHAFAETLRQPVIEGTNRYRACYYWVHLLDDAKLAYKAGTGTSNQLISALSKVEMNVATAESNTVVVGGGK
jgi:hypothetical protein